MLDNYNVFNNRGFEKTVKPLFSEIALYKELF